MGQEFFVNSQELEQKVRNLLPSQGGLGAGQDLSASTQIVPIIDLTETAEGSNVRPDLQTAFSLKSITSIQVFNTTSTIINNTGYYRVYGNVTLDGAGDFRFSLTDGVTTKNITQVFGVASTIEIVKFDFIVFIAAGNSLTATSTSASTTFEGNTRQIADIDGNLVDPT